MNEKVKIRFRQSPRKRRHGSRGIVFRRDGQTRELSREDAEHLLKWWPDNFERVLLPLHKCPPLHRPIKLSDITVLTVQYWPQDILETCLLSYLPPEVQFIKLDNRGNKRFRSGAQALNQGIRRAKNDIVICAHEDTMFEKGWFERFIWQECRLQKWGAMGIVGMGFDGCIHWGRKYNLPCKVASLDECCIIVNRRNGIWFDEETFRGFHCYGVDFCLQAYNNGLNVYVVSGPATHRGRSGRYPSPKSWLAELKPTQKILKNKWEKIFPQILTTTGTL